MNRRASLSLDARVDLAGILSTSESRFGRNAMLRYDRLLAQSLEDLANDLGRIGSEERSIFGPSVRVYPIRFSRTRARSELGLVGAPRHVVLYRHIVPEVIGIGRILHEAMDVSRHLPADYGDG